MILTYHTQKGECCQNTAASRSQSYKLTGFKLFIRNNKGQKNLWIERCVTEKVSFAAAIHLTWDPWTVKE